MIIIKGKYPDQAIKTCNSKDPEVIAEWFHKEFKSDFEDEDYDRDFSEIMISIYQGKPDLEIIEEYLNYICDRTIEKWN